MYFMNFLTKINFIFVFFTLIKADKILNFTVDLEIDKNGQLTVIENIAFNFDQKKHGFFRDLPTKYTDNLHNRYNVNLIVDSILANNQKTDYTVKPFANGYRIKIGSPTSYVQGEVNYQIKYQVNRQIGFFKKHDEIFWNAIGNGFPFTIENAKVKVTLPAGFEIQKIVANTGLFKKNNQNYTADFQGNVAEFQTTKPLKPSEGFTVAVAWHKGLIKPPTVFQKIKWFLQDNGAVIFLILSLLLLVIYYLIILLKFVTNPYKKSIIPLYGVDNLLPADVSYIFNKCRYKDKILACTTVDMAVKGCLYIDKKSFGSYKLKFKNKLPKEQVYYQILEKFFGKNLNQRKSVEISANDLTDQILVNDAQKVLNKYLAQQHDQQIIKTYYSYQIFSLVVSIISSVLLYFTATSFFALIGIIAFVLMNIWFSFKLRVYTQDGQEVLEKILGFKMFLSFTEAQRLKYLSVDSRSPQEYEKFLPYAMALGVEKNWNGQYTSLFSKMAEEGHAYVPAWYWYNGHHSSNYDISFANGFNSSMTNFIAASPNRPGSYSGFSSGGSGGGTGRGGGGGGGGTW
jgi:uncharacterized membrane protein YgcG